MREAAAGDRTFSLVGLSAAAITAVAGTTSPQAVAGIVTGIGFIGGGVVFRGGMGTIKGLTTAAAVLAAAAIGITAGYGHLLLATMVTFLVLVVLEVRNIPVLRRLDARRYQGRLRTDNAPPLGMDDMPPEA